MDTNELITVAVVVLAGSTFVTDVRAGNGWPWHVIVAAGIVGLFLTFIALVSAALANAFAILIIIVALLKNGTGLLGAAQANQKKA